MVVVGDRVSIRLIKGLVRTRLFEELVPDIDVHLLEHEPHVAPQEKTHPLAEVPMASSRFKELYETLKKATRRLRKK